MMEWLMKVVRVRPSGRTPRRACKEAPLHPHPRAPHDPAGPVRLAGRVLCALLPWGALDGQIPSANDPYGFSTRVWGVDDGLPQSTPTRMVVDERGFVWGGSFGGVFRFDGSAFQTFDLNRLPGLGSNQVTALARSMRGGFWVAGVTGNILRVVDGEVVAELPRPATQMDETSVLLETRDGTLWNWAFEEIYAYFPHGDSDGAWSRVATEVLRHWPGVPLAEIAPGELLGGTTDGFFRLNRDGLVRLRAPPFDYGARVFAILKDREGILWVGLEDGVVALVGDQRIPVPTISGTTENLAQAPDGAIWATGERGVWRIHGPGMDQAGPLDLRAIEVTTVPWDGPRPVSLAVVPDGIALVGSLGGGLTAIAPRVGRLFAMSEHWEPAPALPDGRDPTVHSVMADRLGRIWAAKECGPLIRIDGLPGEEGRTALEVGMRIPGCTLSLALGPGGDVWATDNTALLRISEAGVVTRIPLGSIVRSGPGFLEVTPRMILPLSSDSILVGTTEGGLSLVRHDGTVEPVQGWDTLLEGGVVSGVQTEKGTLWIGGVGTARMRSPEGVWTTFRAEDGIPPGPVRVLRPDPTGNGGLWIGGYGGGVVYRDPAGTITPLPLQDQTISALLDLEDGSFWIPQNSGIAVLDRATLDRVRAGDPGLVGFRRLRAVDGIPEVNNGRPAATRLPSGRLAIGTVQGLLLVDPGRLPPAAASPSIRVDRLRTPLREIASSDGRIALERNERLVEIDLGYPAFRASDPVRVRYRLVGRGVQDDWVLTSSPRVIQLVSLNPGVARLEVETSKAGRDWAGGQILELRLAPYLWERGSVQILVLAIFLALITVAALSQVRAQKAEAIALRERIQREANQAALAEQQRREVAIVGRQVMAGELSASLTHEVSQPISAITQTVQALRWEWDRNLLNPADLGESLDDLLEQSTRARDIIQSFRRFLAEGYPKGEIVHVRSTAERVPSLLAHDLREAGARLSLELPQADLAVWGDRALLQQVLLILSSNAVESVAGLPEERRLVRVRIRPHGRGGFRASVVDAGEGIPPSRQSALFEPFNSTKVGGMGMGLSIARRIVLAHGGQIRLRSRPGEGTVASFLIPLDPQRGRGGSV
jgi:signal transduction histidine kinase/ligand-binding sensor domain-containing protein